MQHGKIWETTDDYFKQLIGDGINSNTDTWEKFMMAINIDGWLTGNKWQDTLWPWHNSIQLERTDYDFELVKTDENGNAITSDATAFQIWYVNENGEKVYFTQNENGEFTETTDPNAVVKTNEEGKLSSLYTLMKDKIYYLQEAEAPEGYVIDPTVYVLTDSADKIDEEKLQAEADAKKEALEKDLNALLENAPDYAASSEKFQELKKKIDAKTGSDTAAYADALQAQLNELKANDMSIKDLSATLNSTKDQVQADIDAFEAKREELTNLYNNASSRIDALNSSLQLPAYGVRGPPGRCPGQSVQLQWLQVRSGQHYLHPGVSEAQGASGDTASSEGCQGGDGRPCLRQGDRQAGEADRAGGQSDL